VFKYICDMIPSYLVYNFLLRGRDSGIIDLDYKDEWDILFNSQIISGDCLKMTFLAWSTALFLQKLCPGLVLDKVCYSDTG